MDSSAPTNLEALLSQATWVRQLAAHLVRDPDQAEDLAQETWRRALENPTTAEIPEQGLRAWLGRVMRNLVTDRQKESDLRSWHERDASRSERWSHAELHDRVVLQRELAEAVLSLEQPYQSAITLRYLEGLAPREIARRQNVTYDAVRTRISRGLAMLRARLDRDHDGDRDAWCAVFAGLISKGTDPHAAPAPGGGSLILGVDAKLVTGVVIAWAAALLLVWRVIGTGPSKHGAWSPEVTRLHADRPVPYDGASGPIPSDRSPLERQEPPAARVVDREHDLHGSVIDASGRVVVGARVEVIRDDTSGLWRDVDTVRVRRSVAVTSTDARGEFAVTLPVGRPFDLEVSAPGRATTSLGFRYAGERVTVELNDPAALEGQVTTSASGNPVAHARLELSTDWGTLDGDLPLSLRGGETDADGRFRFEKLPAIPVQLKVVPPAAGAFVVRPLALTSGRTCEENVVIEPGLEMRGRVIDALTQAPIPDAEVGEVRRFERMSRANANGDYVYSGLRTRGSVWFAARAPGYGQQTCVFRSVTGVDDLPDRYDFALTRGRVTRGRILDGEGRGIEGVSVAAAANRRSEPPPTGTDWIGGRTDDRGRFELSGLRRDLSHTLFARKDDFGAVAFELPAAESELEVIDLGDVVLPPASVLHGTVIDESGNAVQGWEVTLRGSNRDRERYRSERDARDAAVDVRVATRTARTDDLGRFAFTDLAMGDYSVEAGLPDSRWRTSASVSLARGASVRDVQLVIRSLDTISGTVRDAEGHAVVGARLTVSAESLRAGTRAYGLTDSSGSFSIHGIPPGTYRIRVVANDVHLAGDASGACNFLAREVGGVSSDERSLAIVLEPAALIRGRVVDADGRGVHDSRVIVRIPGRDDTPGTIAGLDGKFSVAIPVAVSVDVEAYPVSLGCAILPRRPDVPALGGARVSSVVPGDQEVIIRLPR